MGIQEVSGSCLCGAVRFRVGLPSLFCGHCHCSMCRRNHGAGFVTWFGVPRAQLDLHTGRDELRRYASSQHGTRTFCGRCGSSLFCESEKRPDEVDIPLANVEGPIDRAPQLHVYFDDRASWVSVSDRLPRLGGPSGMEPREPEDPGVLEVALLNVRPGEGTRFEEAFAEAQAIIASMPGYRSHELRGCLETPDRYLLLVWWQDLESHTVGFRRAPEYQRWKELLHHFYDPFPEVEHYRVVHEDSV